MNSMVAEEIASKVKPGEDKEMTVLVCKDKKGMVEVKPLSARKDYDDSPKENYSKRPKAVQMAMMS